MAPARRVVPSRSQHAVVELLRAANRLHGLLARAIEPQGITGQQYNVFRILRGAGPDGLPMLILADRMIERTPGITRIVDRLERSHMAQRERRGSDRRRVHARITPTGLDSLERLERPVEEATRAAVAALDASELGQLVAAGTGRAG